MVRPPCTAGKYTVRLEYDEEFVAEWLTGSLIRYSKKLEREKLSAIRERMTAGLDIEEKDVLSIPTYFVVPDDPNADWGTSLNRTVARNVGMVNMQVVNNHLMVSPTLRPSTRTGQGRDGAGEHPAEVVCQGSSTRAPSQPAVAGRTLRLGAAGRDPAADRDVLRQAIGGKHDPTQASA